MFQEGKTHHFGISRGATFAVKNKYQKKGANLTSPNEILHIHYTYTTSKYTTHTLLMNILHIHYTHTTTNTLHIHYYKYTTHTLHIHY